jgi:hypothetical protein
MRTRRLLPPAFAFAATAVGLSPLWVPWIGEGAATQWTLLALAVAFAAKAGRFAWWRRRMRRRDGGLTAWGEALTDFLFALVSMDAALALGYAVLWSFGRHAGLPPFWVRTVTRALVLGGVAYVHATGFAADWEMIQAGNQLRVHEGDRGDDELAVLRAELAWSRKEIVRLKLKAGEVDGLGIELGGVV